MSLNDDSTQEMIRLLEIDNVYIISTITFEARTQQYKKIHEIAFDSEHEACHYMKEELQIDIPQPAKLPWRGYEQD